jgi:hypothetical protein
MIRRACTLVATGVVLAAAGGSATAGDRQASAYFVTPSRNIICLWSPETEGQPRTYLRCDIRSGLEPRPRRPSSCDVDWALGLSMASVGKASPTCAGDSFFQGWRPVLAYGTTWRKRGFTCRSQRIGLTCRNAAGHGFFLSRERWRRL